MQHMSTVMHFFLQALCQGPEGRSLNSFGRRRRDTSFRLGRELNEDISLREMFRVYETREEIPRMMEGGKKKSPTLAKKQVCLNSSEYYGMVTTFLVSALALIVMQKIDPYTMVLAAGFYGPLCHCGCWCILPQSSTIFKQTVRW